MRIFYFTSRELVQDDAVQIKNGDICIINDSNALSVCVITSELCKFAPDSNYLDIIYLNEASSNITVSNPIIFSYNGISKRFGNINVLKEIMGEIDNRTIHNFIEECISIINYKEDRFSCRIMSGLVHKPLGKLEIFIHPKNYQELKPASQLAVVKEEDCISINETSTKVGKDMGNYSENIKANPSEFYFYDYLDQIVREEWIRLYNEKMSPRKILYELKAKHKRSFRSAIKKFNSEYPNLNLYSLKPSLEKGIDSIVSIYPLNEFEFIFKELTNKGFTQITSDIWEDENRKRFRISITPLE